MIRFNNITKKYYGKEVIHSVSMIIPKGEIVSIIGASGCGKTTMLKMINRIIPITAGDILINGESIKNINPVQLRRKIGYVIQQTGIFPHMTIKENLEVVMELHSINKNEWARKIDTMISMIGLSNDILNRYPIELSGGQQQRIGFARALITDPDIILMDEPFSAIDPINRLTLQDELRALQETLHKTIVFVTHDMDEAIKISDRICLMKDGQIEQYDTPEQILREPATSFVVSFIGKNRIWNSPEFIKAEDIMIKADNLCRPKDSLIRCIYKIKNTLHNFLIIINPIDNTFMGLVSARIIREQDDLSQYAEDIMQQPVAVAHIGDSLPEVLTTVKQLHSPHMIVLDDDERPIGIITQASLVATLGKQYVDEEKVV